MARVERSIRVDAVVLRHSDWGEADRLLILDTREAGKLRAVAKGARKIRSRKAGHLEPFTRVALMLARGRDLWIVTQAATIDAFQALREDLEKTGYAAYVIEVLDRFTYEEGEHRELYQLLIETLDRIANSDQAFLAVRYYELRLLDLLGFRPELTYCVKCERPIVAEDQYFSPLLGGVVCPTCGAAMPGLLPVTMTALKYLRHFQRSSYEEAAKATLTPPVMRELEALLQNFLTFHLERKINSSAFLREVRGD
jgi:DNA repair protein RecO (recombination protein O)